MVAGVRRASEPQHRPRCLARSRRSRRPGGASVGRAIVRGRCGALKSTVASFRRVVMFDLQHGAKSCRAGSLALCSHLPRTPAEPPDGPEPPDGRFLKGFCR